MSNLVFQDQRGICSLLTSICLLHYIILVAIHVLIIILNRPHDRVLLKEMKADWHACLDNKVGFKVSFKTLCSIKSFCSVAFDSYTLW